MALMNSMTTSLTKKFLCKKLARDFVESSCKNKNIKTTSRLLKKEELVHAFKAKIIEEAEEVSEALDKNELIEELGDLMEVIESFMKTADIDPLAVKKSRELKKNQIGGFETGLYLEYIEVALDSPDFTRYSSRPHKYPVLT